MIRFSGSPSLVGNGNSARGGDGDARGVLFSLLEKQCWNYREVVSGRVMAVLGDEIYRCRSDSSLRLSTTRKLMQVPFPCGSQGLLVNVLSK